MFLELLYFNVTCIYCNNYNLYDLYYSLFSDINMYFLRRYYVYAVCVCAAVERC